MTIRVLKPRNEWAELANLMERLESWQVRTLELDTMNHVRLSALAMQAKAWAAGARTEPDVELSSASELLDRAMDVAIKLFLDEPTDELSDFQLELMQVGDGIRR